MKKYHYATVSMSALCALAKVPQPTDSYTADDEQSRTIIGLLNSGYRLVHHHDHGDCALFEKEIVTDFREDIWREFVNKNARPGDVANLILNRDALLAVVKESVAAWDAWRNGPDDDGSPEPGYIASGRALLAQSMGTTLCPKCKQPEPQGMSCMCFDNHCE